MSLRSIFTIAALFACLVMSGQSDSTEISQLLYSQSEAWNRGDIEGFMEGYTNDSELHFLGAGGLTKGWRETLERYKRVYPDASAMGKLRFELHEITRRTEDVYTVVGQYFLDRATLEDLNGYFLLVVVRTTDGWRVAADSTH
jgi:ketosteroid isomerase-like protein